MTINISLDQDLNRAALTALRDDPSAPISISDAVDFHAREKARIARFATRYGITLEQALAEVTE